MPTPQVASPVTNTEEKVFPFKIGADPEFLLFLGKKMAPSKKTLIPYLSKRNLTASGDEGFKVKTHGVLGWDGHSDTGEMRPTPSNNHEKLTKNIQELYKELNKAVPFLDVTTLSISNPIGGHIHLEIPPEKTSEIIDNNQKQSIITRMIACLIIPILASEHRLCAASRYSTSYGKASDLRIENKGTTYTVEVRGLSAEWTVNEEITKATLAYMGVIWNEILFHPENIQKSKIIFKNKTQIGAIQEMLLSDFKPIIKTVTSEIAKLVKTFELYPKYKEEVDTILNIEKIRKIKEDVGWNVNRGWNFKEEKTLTKKEILSSRTVNKKLKELNYEKNSEEYTLTYNNDYNVGLFTNAISERITALGWKLKKEYFFFGLNKEFEGYAIANINKNQFFAVPKNRPLNSTIETLEKMKNRFMDFRGKSIKIDPQTGKIVGSQRDFILVGIPYDIRADKKINSLISLIWDIDNDIKKAKKKEELTEEDFILKKEAPKTTEELQAIEEEKQVKEILQEQKEIDLENLSRTIWGEQNTTEMEETVESLINNVEENNTY